MQVYRTGAVASRKINQTKSLRRIYYRWYYTSPRTGKTGSFFCWDFTIYSNAFCEKSANQVFTIKMKYDIILLLYYILFRSSNKEEF